MRHSGEGRTFPAQQPGMDHACSLIRHLLDDAAARRRVCDSRNRNANGAYASMTRYVGVMMGTTAIPEFVVVGIAGSPRERAEVVSLCRESGASQGN